MKKSVFIALAAMMAFGLVSINAVEVSAAESAISAKPKKEYKTVVFDVQLDCENCAKKVRENIAFEKGVKGLEVSVESQTVTVKYDADKTDVETLRLAIEKLGYKATVKK